MNTPKARSNRRGKYYLAEVALARGPQSIGAVGDASYGVLYGRNWALVLDREDNKLHLYQEQGGTWVEVPVPEIPHDGREIRHISLCFDQSARDVMAYERAGQVWVRQWDAVAGAFTMRGPFAGVDPVLVQDTTVGFYQPDSDVLLFYLSPDRKALKMRVQRDVFAVEYVLELYPTEKILDQAVSLPYQFELIGEGLNVRSEIYPVHLPLDDLGTPVFTAPITGDYFPVVVVKDVGLDDLGNSLFSAPSTATYFPLVVVQDLGLEDLGTPTFTAPATATYYALVDSQNLPLDDFGNPTFVAPATATYYLVVAVHDLTAAGYTSPDDLGSAVFSAPTGGQYVTA